MTQIKYWFDLGIAAAAVISGLIIGWYLAMKILDKIIREWKLRKHKKDLEIDRFISNNLAELRHESDSCRSKFIQFHNGSSFANGKSMKKMSMTHESCHPGMVPTTRGTTDQMLSLFVDMLDLLEQDSPKMITVNSIKDSYFKSYLQSNHVIAFAILPIKNTKGGTIGCVLCEWCAWVFADRVHEKKFEQKFVEIRNSIEYTISTDKKR